MATVNLRQPVTADDLDCQSPSESKQPLTPSSSCTHLTDQNGLLHENASRDGQTNDSLRNSFQRDGFILFHDAIDASFVNTLREHLDEVIIGRYDRGRRPDKIPRFLTDSSKMSGSSSVDCNWCAQNRVVQIINIHKSDSEFRKLAVSPDIGRFVAEVAGWERGARLAQDQVWAKPPGSPPIVFHRDSPYFMFMPADVVTVWIALDDMDEEVGPLEYVRGSHKWGDGRVGSSSSFFQSDSGISLLHSAAKIEGITDPSNLQIFTTSGLRAGGLSIHHGKLWHGSGKNRSQSLPRRGLGLHYVPAEVHFTKVAKKSKLWKSYIPDGVSEEDLRWAELSEEDFPVVWTRQKKK